DDGYQPASAFALPRKIPLHPFRWATPRSDDRHDGFSCCCIQSVSLKCHEVRELLDAFIGDQLLIETISHIVRYLEACPKCRAELEERLMLKTRLKSAFRNAPDLAPGSSFLSRVRPCLRGHQRRRGLWRRWLKYLVRHNRSC